MNQFVNTGRVDYDALLLQLKKRFSQQLQRPGVLHLRQRAGQLLGSGAPVSNFQVGQDMHLELNDGPTDFDYRHNFTVSGTALVPKTYGLNVSWVSRWLSGSPFSLTNGAIDPDQNGIQAEPLAAGRRRESRELGWRRRAAIRPRPNVRIPDRGRRRRRTQSNRAWPRRARVAPRSGRPGDATRWHRGRAPTSPA